MTVRGGVIAGGSRSGISIAGIGGRLPCCDHDAPWSGGQSAASGDVSRSAASEDFRCGVIWALAAGGSHRARADSRRGKPRRGKPSRYPRWGSIQQQPSLDAPPLEASDKPSDYALSQWQTQRHVARHQNPSDLR